MPGDSMLFRWPSWSIAALLALALMLALLLGSAVGRRSARLGRTQPLGSLETMASGLLGLLLAFNFNIAQNRFDARQSILVREANAIGTAYLRCSVLADGDRAPCRDRFRRYTETRIVAYEAFSRRDERMLVDSLKAGEKEQSELWQQVSRAVRANPNPATGLLMNALNVVIDVDAERRASIRIVVPQAVSLAIVFVCAAWATLLGYSAGRRNSRPKVAWLVVALLISVVFGVALDFDRPRSGYITTEAAEKAMLNLLTSMQTPPVD